MRKEHSSTSARFRATLIWTATCATIAAGVNLYEILKGLLT